MKLQTFFSKYFYTNVTVRFPDFFSFYYFFPNMTHIINTDNYDYIVIGGGTSGAVAARRLAEAEANYSVCLLEAGPRLVYLNLIVIS